MSAMIIPLIKPSYDHALRAQSPSFRCHKGFPARRDPAAEAPASLLDGIGEAFTLKMRQHTAHAAIAIPALPVPSASSRTNSPLPQKFQY